MYPHQPGPRGGPPRDNFQQFAAVELFCNRCGGPMPVRERLLLILPDGNLLAYYCTNCGELLGKRKDTAAPRM